MKNHKQLASDTFYRYLNAQSFDDEVWLPIPGYETRYLISNKGRVMRISRNCHPTLGMIKKTDKHFLMRGNGSPEGYRTVDLYGGDGNSRQKSVHRLVAEAFIPNPENKPTVDHINGVPWNNNVENLRWATYIEQQQTVASLGHRSHVANNPYSEIRRAWERSCQVRRKQVICTDTGQIFSSVAEADQFASGGKANGNLSTALKHNNGFYRGKHYDYYTGGGER